MKPFDLEKALAGEPFNIYGNKYGDKYFAAKVVGDILIHYILNEENKIIATGFNSITFLKNESKAVMCEEPEQKRFINGIEVPEPVTLDTMEEGGYYWFPAFNKDCRVYSDIFYSESLIERNLIKRGLVFKTKEGAEAMAKALLNYKVEMREE